MSKLYKVLISVELCVCAEDEDDAIKTGLNNCVEEIGMFGKGTAKLINSKTDISDTWLDSVPYSSSKIETEARTCKQIVEEIKVEKVEEVVKIEEKIEVRIDQEEKPKMPKIRFVK